MHEAWRIVGGLYRLLRRPGAPGAAAGVRYLCYHSIVPDGAPPQDYSVTESAFRAQLRYLCDTGFRIVSLPQSLAGLGGGGGLRRAVCLTFDDGLLTCWTVAWPILREHGLSAHFFVNAGLIGPRPARERPGVRCMEWGMLQRILAEGGTVGSHSFTHANLRELPPAALGDELKRGRAAIEERLEVPVTSLAYPYGTFDKRVAAAAAAAGYDFAFTTRFGALAALPQGEARFLVPRTMIDPDEPHAIFRLKVEGGFDWIAAYSAAKDSLLPRRAA